MPSSGSWLRAGFEKHEAVNYFLMMRGRVVVELYLLGSKRFSRAESLTSSSCCGVAERKQGAGRVWKRLRLIPFALLVSLTVSQISGRRPLLPSTQHCPFIPPSDLRL